ncbi:MAG: radical SAM protein [Deltaproteobacteria bacterium]|nr:radical SAM protein [Deltaproteobacteria bacterium]
MGKLFYSQSYGCFTRRIESATIERYLTICGWTPGPLADADLIVVSSCAVTQNNIDASMECVRKIMDEKKPAAKMIVTGCLPGADRARLETIFDGPVLSPYNLHELEQLINSNVPFDLPVSDHFPKLTSGPFHQPNSFVIRTNYGCGHFCSFCGIRKVYPKIRSRSIASITEELARETSEKFVEGIVLASEDLTAYGKDIGTNLLSLLSAISDLGLKQKIALPRIHPDYVLANQEKFLEFFTKNQFSFIGLVLNSGSPHVLNIMRRRYDVDRAVELMNKIRRVSPKTIISSDCIIGHPGETEEDFRLSIRLFIEAPLDLVHTAKFSLIRGTPAESLADHVPQEVIEERFRRFVDTFSVLRPETHIA